MIVTAIDPALLAYDSGDFYDGRQCSLERLKALTNHRRVINEYSIRVAVSRSFMNCVLSLFPWQQCGNSVLRDVREFILSDLERRADYLDTNESVEVGISPEGVLCQYVTCQELVCAWEQISAKHITSPDTAHSTFSVSTWDCPNIVPELELTVPPTGVSQASTPSGRYRIPLVWDCDSWARLLSTQDWWPDLKRMVSLTFITNHAIRSHAGANDRPMDFQCSEAFWKSAERYCKDGYRRQSFVTALTKLLYGIHDKGLGLETVKGRSGVYRFRVTDSDRVHYHTEGPRIVIDEIGPHEIDGVG